MRWKMWIVPAIALSLLGLGAAQALDGKNSYAVSPELTWADVEDVAIGLAPGLTYNNSRPCLGFSADGDGYLLAVSSSVDDTDDDWPDDICHWHELVSFTPEVSTSVMSVLRVNSWYGGVVRGLAVVPDSLTNHAALEAGHVVLLVDRVSAWKTHDDQGDPVDPYYYVDSWSREVWQVDPSVTGEAYDAALAKAGIRPANVDVLYSEVVTDVRPTSMALALDGTLYYALGDPAQEGSGSLWALEWSNGSLVEREVLEDGSITGGLAVDAAGNVYAFDRSDGATSEETDRVLVIDPSTSPATVDVYATFSSKLFSKSYTVTGRTLGLAFDSDGQLWMNGVYASKGSARRAVLQVPAWGTIVSGDRIAETTGTLSWGEIASGPDGVLYVVEDHDVLYSLTPPTDSGGGGDTGGGGGGNGGGKGKNK